MAGRPKVDIVGQRYGDYTVLCYASGNFWLTRCICGQMRRINGWLIRAQISAPRCNHNHLGLTSRQYEVAQMAAEGLMNKEIARRLVISERTVIHHMQDAFAKTGVHTRQELAALLRDT